MHTWMLLLGEKENNCGHRFPASHEFQFISAHNENQPAKTNMNISFALIFCQGLIIVSHTHAEETQIHHPWCFQGSSGVWEVFSKSFLDVRTFLNPPVPAYGFWQKHQGKDQSSLLRIINLKENSHLCKLIFIWCGNGMTEKVVFKPGGQSQSLWSGFKSRSAIM